MIDIEKIGERELFHLWSIFTQILVGIEQGGFNFRDRSRVEKSISELAEIINNHTPREKDSSGKELPFKLTQDEKEKIAEIAEHNKILVINDFQHAEGLSRYVQERLALKDIVNDSIDVLDANGRIKQRIIVMPPATELSKLLGKDVSENLYTDLATSANIVWNSSPEFGLVSKEIFEASHGVYDPQYLDSLTLPKEVATNEMLNNLCKQAKQSYYIMENTETHECTMYFSRDSKFPGIAALAFNDTMSQKSTLMEQMAQEDLVDRGKRLEIASHAEGKNNFCVCVGGNTDKKENCNFLYFDFTSAEGPKCMHYVPGKGFEKEEDGSIKNLFTEYGLKRDHSNIGELSQELAAVIGNAPQWAVVSNDEQINSVLNNHGLSKSEYTKLNPSKTIDTSHVPTVLALGRENERTEELVTFFQQFKDKDLEKLFEYDKERDGSMYDDLCRYALLKKIKQELVNNGGDELQDKLSDVEKRKMLNKKINVLLSGKEETDEPAVAKFHVSVNDRSKDDQIMKDAEDIRKNLEKKFREMEGPGEGKAYNVENFFKFVEDREFVDAALAVKSAQKNTGIANDKNRVGLSKNEEHVKNVITTTRSEPIIPPKGESR